MLGGVHTVQEIEQAIEKLAPEDFTRVASWIGKRLNEQWDRQIERDAASGNLDFLFDEAKSEREERKLRAWPE
jgi:hypothetical protein